MINGRDHIQRSILPIPDRTQVRLTTYDAKDPNTKFAPIEPLRPPKGAPNVLVVLLDDVGFGASSAFGGPVNMPTAERLAANGLKYTRFHTTALCSPTRAALLTGRNHHSVGMGCVTEAATSAPGQTSLRPNTKAPLPDILKLNGYATAQFGKCHEVPTWQTGPTGPFDQWPTGGGGFEYFYGFIGGECNQYEPELYEGTTAVTPPKTAEEGYHLTEDLADKAISWVRQQKALAGGDKPFFVYFAPGATHAPHHVPKEWADKYKGKFDHGWDRQRELTFACQKEVGVISSDCELTWRHDEIPAWEDMPDDLKPVLARQMEVYAGFLEHADHQVGRLVDALEELGILKDTLIYFIIGDNGASAEGTVQGTFNEAILLNGITGIETPEFLKAHIDEFGTPAAYNHYAVGWAHAMCTPYQWTKQVASHWGGTRNGTIVHWPNGIKAKGELRHQFSHVIDVAPTILDCAGLPEPEMVHGVTQSSMEGTSMRYSFEDAGAEERHDVQYFEMFGNRGIYYKGWSAITKHRTPWVVTAATTIPFDQDVWELYDGTKDWTQAHDLAQQMPEKLKELHLMFAIEAVKYNVFPLDDRLVERFDPARAGRPILVQGSSQLLFPGMGRLSEHAVLPMKNVSYSITAEVTVRDQAAEGVIIAQGGRFGGWSLYVQDGRAMFAYNYLGLEMYRTQAQQPLPAGTHQVRAEFAYEGGGVGKGGTLTLRYDGQEVGRGHIPRTQPLIFSAEESTDIGYETGSLVVPDYPANNGHFSGTIHWVQLDVGQDNFNHLITPEDRLHMVMTRQ
jgi:arylsulfatase